MRQGKRETKRDVAGGEKTKTKLKIFLENADKKDPLGGQKETTSVPRTKNPKEYTDTSSRPHTQNPRLENKIPKHKKKMVFENKPQNIVSKMCQTSHKKHGQ